MTELTEAERRRIEKWTAMVPRPEFADRVAAHVVQRAIMRRAVIPAACVVAVAVAAIMLVWPARDFELDPRPEPHVSVRGTISPADAAVVDPVIGPVITTGPASYDLQVVAGESFTVHDPRGETAIEIGDGGKCNGGVIVDAKGVDFPNAAVGADEHAARIYVHAGTWIYRLRCKSDVSPIASGRFVIVRDNGRRPLPVPVSPPAYPVDDDGRTWRISYQNVIPSIVFRARGRAKHYRLHLAANGNVETFDATTQSIHVPGTKLRETTYSFWFDLDGVRDGSCRAASPCNPSTLTIEFDQTAPQVFVSSPPDDDIWGTVLDVAGFVLHGWTPSIGSVTIPTNSNGAFAARVPPPASRALVIRFTHPQRGVHYYLRRPKP